MPLLQNYHPSPWPDTVYSEHLFAKHHHYIQFGYCYVVGKQGLLQQWVSTIILLKVVSLRPATSASPQCTVLSIVGNAIHNH